MRKWGFAIGLAGWLVMAFTEYRDLGFIVFISGFMIFAFGIVTYITRSSFHEIEPSASKGLKVAAVGFGVTVTGVGLEVLFAGRFDTVFYVFWGIGFGLMLIGIGNFILGFLRSRKTPHN